MIAKRPITRHINSGLYSIGPNISGSLNDMLSDSDYTHFVDFVQIKCD